MINILFLNSEKKNDKMNIILYVKLIKSIQK